MHFRMDTYEHRLHAAPSNAVVFLNKQRLTTWGNPGFTQNVTMLGTATLPARSLRDSSRALASATAAAAATLGLDVGESGSAPVRRTWRHTGSKGACFSPWLHHGYTMVTGNTPDVFWPSSNAISGKLPMSSFHFTSQPCIAGQLLNFNSGSHGNPTCASEMV
jgi:hypothetical protein